MDYYYIIFMYLHLSCQFLCFCTKRWKRAALIFFPNPFSTHLDTFDRRALLFHMTCSWKWEWRYITDYRQRNLESVRAQCNNLTYSLLQSINAAVKILPTRFRLNLSFYLIMPKYLRVQLVQLPTDALRDPGGSNHYCNNVHAVLLTWDHACMSINCFEIYMIKCVVKNIDFSVFRLTDWHDIFGFILICMYSLLAKSQKGIKL